MSEHSIYDAFTSQNSVSLLCWNTKSFAKWQHILFFIYRVRSTYQSHTKKLSTMICYPHQKTEALLILAIMDHQAKDLIICHFIARTIQSHLTQSALKNKEVLINI